MAPEPEVAIGQLVAQKGQSIDDKAELFTISGASGAATITLPKSQTAPGDRVIVIDELTIPVDHTNRITDPQLLSKITATGPYQSARAMSVEKNDKKVTFQAKWRLAEPLVVFVLSPKAVFGITGTKACVSVKGQATPVQLVSSELGSALVTSSMPLTEVDANPDKTATCPS